jgi:hypothetical protein
LTTSLKKQTKVSVKLLSLQPLESKKESEETSDTSNALVQMTPASKLPTVNVTDHEIIHWTVLYLSKKNPRKASWDDLEKTLGSTFPGITKERIHNLIVAHKNLFTIINKEVVVLCELNQEFVGHYFGLDLGMNVVFTIENSWLSLAEPCSVAISKTITVRGIACVVGGKVGKKKRQVFFHFGNYKSFMINTALCKDYQQGQILTSVLCLRKVVNYISQRIHCNTNFLGLHVKISIFYTA